MSEFWPIIVDSTLFYSLACVLNSWSLASCILYRRSWKLGQWDLYRSRLLRAGLQGFIFLGQSHHSFSASLHQLKGSSLPSPTMMDWAPWNHDLCPSFLPSFTLFCWLFNHRDEIWAPVLSFLPGSHPGNSITFGPRVFLGVSWLRQSLRLPLIWIMLT